jgi:hypothetical protein
VAVEARNLAPLPGDVDFHERAIERPERMTGTAHQFSQDLGDMLGSRAGIDTW